jgi:CHASE2 domain-containing sensor protein
LQFWEWLAVDLLFQLRPSEPIDRRILLVGFTAQDMEQLKTSRLNDAQLAQLIQMIKTGKPRAIGVDIFRDYPVPPGHEALMSTFRTTPNLIGVGKQTGNRGDPDYDLIAPPPIPQKQIADVSAVLDGDDVQRRGFLYPVTKKQSIPSLGLALAYRYLEPQGIFPQNSDRGGLFDLGSVTFYPFKNNTGVYVKADDRSYQMLMNWRKAPFERVSVADVLNGKVAPQRFRSKVVVIGGYAPKVGDEFLTPFSRGLTSTPRKMLGMEAQAQLTSQVLSAVLDGRPLVKVWSEPWLSLWSLAWGLATFAFITTQNRSGWKGLAFILVSTCGLGGLAYFAFLEAYWLPLVPPVVTIGFVGISLLILDYELGRLEDLMKIQDLNQKLKLKLDQRQVYRDLVVLANQLGTSLASPLQHLINSKTLVLQQEEALSAQIAHHLWDQKSVEAVYVALAQLTATLHTQAEQIDSVCFKLAQHLPSFEGLIRADRFLERGEISLQAAIEQSIAYIRPVIYDEYGLNLSESLTLNFLAGQDERISEPNRWVILLNRIFDEVLLQCQLADEPFPKIEVTTQATDEGSQIAITISTCYQPQEMTQYFCQGILDFYGGELSVEQEDEVTRWVILLPLD